MLSRACRVHARLVGATRQHAVVTGVFPPRLAFSTKHKGTEAVPFRVSAVERDGAWKKWVRNHSPFLLPPKVISSSSWYLPFWVFDAAVSLSHSGRKQHVLPPAAALQVYGGHAFRRPMLEVLKNPLGSACPFSADMMDIGPAPTPGLLGSRPSSKPARVDVDVWEVFENTALARVRSALLAHFQGQMGGMCQVHLHDITSHKVHMPAHIIEYQHWGQTYRVFINGHTGEAFGLQDAESMFGEGIAGGLVKAKALLGSSWSWGAMGGGMWLGASKALIPIAATLLRILLLPPVALGIGGAIAAFNARLYVGSRMAQQSSREAWQVERDEERAMQAMMSDDWVFRPAGLHSTPRQTFKHKPQPKATPKTRAQPKAKPRAKPKAPPKAKTWQPHPVPAGDHYAMLGLDLGPATSVEEITKAFRRELMRYHPDHNQHTGLDLAAASSRTQDILAAYKVLRNPKTRAVYDAGWRGGK